MSNLPRGFISPLLLALVAVLLVGGGAYVYVNNKQVNQPTTAQTADWKIFATTTTSSIISYDPTGIASPIIDFSFRYPSGWSICGKVSSDTEYVTVSDDCSSAGGKPFAYPTNYFLVRNIGALDWHDIPSGSLKYEINWKTYQYPLEPMRSISYPSKNIDLVLVGSDSDMQSTLDEIASTFKFTPSTAQTPNSRSIKDVRKGDTFGDLTVQDVGYTVSPGSTGEDTLRSAWVLYSASITLSGKVYRSNIDTPNPICVTIDEKDADKIPQFKEGSRSSWFCFSNPQSALPSTFRNLQETLLNDGGIPVTIEVNNYQQIVASEKDASDTASFVRVVQ